MAPASTPTSTTNTERSSLECPTSLLYVNLVQLSPSRHARKPSRPWSRLQPLSQPLLQSFRRRRRCTVVRRPSVRRPTTQVLVPSVLAVTATWRTRRRALAKLQRSVREVAKSSPSTSQSAQCAQFSDNFDEERYTEPAEMSLSLV